MPRGAYGVMRRVMVLRRTSSAQSFGWSGGQPISLVRLRGASGTPQKMAESTIFTTTDPKKATTRVTAAGFPPLRFMLD